jgi:hypothetical protein
MLRARGLAWHRGVALHLRRSDATFAGKYAVASPSSSSCSSAVDDAVVDVGRLRRKRDVVIVGAGHNGLVAAAYLARQGELGCV